MPDILKVMSFLYENSPVFQTFPTANQEAAGENGTSFTTVVPTLEDLGSNSSLNGTEEDGSEMGTQFPYHMLGFTAACAFIIALLGASGNLLTIIALPMSRSLRTTATAFVVNLAVVELMFCVFVLPLSGAQYTYLMLYNTSLLSDRACIYFTVMRYALTQVELQTIMAIALMRAVAVSCMNFYKRVNTPVVVGVYIALMWAYSFALKIPTALGAFGRYRFNFNTMECDMGVDEASMKARKWMIIIEAIAPVGLIILLYIFIFVMLMRRCRKRAQRFQKRWHAVGSNRAQTPVKLSSQRVSRATIRRPMPPDTSTRVEDDPLPSGSPHMEDQGGEELGEANSLKSNNRKLSSSSFKNLKRMVSETSFRSTFSRRSSNLSQKLSTSRRDMRVARTIFIIFVLIMVCSVPVMVVHIIDPLVQNKNRFLVVHILYWVQYCVNVFIYVLMNRQYRDAYLDALSKLFPSWRRHKGFMFPWEAPSVSSKPTNNPNNGSVRSRRGSLKDAAQRDSDVQSGGLGFSRTGRLSAIPERGSSSIGNESLAQEAQVLPLSTPPLSNSRRGSESKSQKTPAPTEPYYDGIDSHLTSMPCSPFTYGPSHSTSNEFTPLAETQSSSEPVKQAIIASSNLKTLHDKLDSISIDETSPLQSIDEEDELLGDAPNVQSNENPETASKDFYSTVNGVSTDRPANAIPV
ncbi:G protein-coupled receptor rhodopsin-like [Trinorchestia longiramus]|nr:G protein-coupled receptor rhodopsin-like [Trinorchestia longiramus]